MTSLPPLSSWDDTAHSLHRTAQLLGAVRMLALEQVPNYLELSLAIRPHGLSTCTLPGWGEVTLDFREPALEYTPSPEERLCIPLAGHTQESLLDALLAAAETRGHHALPGGATSRVDAFYAALAARGHPFLPRREDVAGTAPLLADPRLGAEYSEALYRIFTGTARFRARLNGPMTPIVVWPEHFDLSFLWFATQRATDDHPHMNFGFAPFSDDIDRPYLYAYAYPMPSGFEDLPLPAPARWHTEGWQGALVPYDDLARMPDPEGAVELIFGTLHRLLALSLVEQQ